MTILQNGPDIQCFSQTAPGLRAQFLLLDFQVDQGFQFFFRRTVSVYREHGHHPDGSAVGNLDTFHPDFLLVIWLVYGRKPPFLTVSPILFFSQSKHIQSFCGACFARHAANAGFDGPGGTGTPTERADAVQGLLWGRRGGKSSSLKGEAPASCRYGLPALVGSAYFIS